MHLIEQGFPRPARATRRRMLLGALVVLLTTPAVVLMADLHARTGIDAWKIAHLVLFAGLFVLTAFGCCQALIGFVLRCCGGDSLRIVTTIDGVPTDTALPPTAIVMPIFNEDPDRVFAGVQAIYESLAQIQPSASFDFFVLSDSTDSNRWIDEETAWAALTRELHARGRLFYRRRRLNINKKAGNITDFCRHWGRRYRYMIVLDADSIMSGDALVKLVRLMECNPRTGIIQTVPRLVNGETPFARLQQFASRLYGSVFQAGLNFWQLSESNYWGHNAIIRLAPFIEHCALPELPGREPIGGRILSHDYVEAALMRRAGWAVWLAIDLDGSYEECPANLIDFAKRDRRWLQGNLQHTWLLTARGLHVLNRLHLLLGVLAYLASPLWLLFLLLSTVLVARFTFTGLTLLPVDSFIPRLGLKYTSEVAVLFGGTLAVLFLPKLLALLALAVRPHAVTEFGGWLRLLASVVIETVASALIAPVLMLFHSKFVLYILLGRGVGWAPQRRGGSAGPDWRETTRTHAGQTVAGALWGAGAYALNSLFFAWLAPVLAGMVVSIPLSFATGSAAPGRLLRRAGLLLVPEESVPPPVLETLRNHPANRAKARTPRAELAADYGLLQAVLDPYVNAVHVSLLREKNTTFPAEVRSLFAQLRNRLIADGPAALSAREKLALLMDAHSMIRLHRELWSHPSAQLAEWWRIAIQQYDLRALTPSTPLHR